MVTKSDVRTLALVSIPIRGGSRMLDGSRYQGIKKFSIAIDNSIYWKVFREKKSLTILAHLPHVLVKEGRMPILLC